MFKEIVHPEIKNHWIQNAESFFFQNVLKNILDIVFLSV